VCKTIIVSFEYGLIQCYFLLGSDVECGDDFGVSVAVAELAVDVASGTDVECDDDFGVSGAVAEVAVDVASGTDVAESEFLRASSSREMRTQWYE
jgi:hypothetical protein